MTSVPERIRKGSRIPGPPGIKSPRTPKEGSHNEKFDTKLTPRSGCQSTRLPKPLPNSSGPFKKSHFHTSPSGTLSHEKEDARKNRTKQHYSSRRLDLVSDAMFDKAMSKANKSGVSLHDEVDITGMNRTLSPPLLERTEEGVFYNRGYNQPPIFIPKLAGVGDEEMSNPDNYLVAIKRSSLLDIKRWAENEKQTVSEELNRLEKKRVENETTLQEQKNRNQSLREMFEKEKKKWEKMMFDTKYENDQLSATSPDEESEKSDEGVLEEDNFSGLGLGYKVLVPGVMITLIAVFYYTIFSYQSVDQRPI